MEKILENVKKTDSFTLFGLFFISLLLLSIVLALLKLFYLPLIFLYIVLGIAAFAYLALKNKNQFKVSRQLLAILLISFGFILLFSTFTTPTIFSGRDQGSYSEAAIRLSQNHQLEFSTPASQEFFKIYGPGEALNFPGFNYAQDGNLITHFPIGYISWLAIFYSIFGLSGLVIANAVSFFIFLLSFYLLSRHYLKPFPAFSSFFLLLTSFIFSWFFKFTLSENLALAIIFFGLLQFALYLKNDKASYLYSSLLSFFILLFTKIEGMAFLTVIFLLLYLKFRKSKKIISCFKNKKIIAISSALAIVYFWNIWVNLAYYKIFTKGLLHSFFPNALADPGESLGFFQNLIYTFRILETYALLPYIAIGLISFIYFLKRKSYDFLAPFFIVLPSFIYLLQPSVSADHPWMLRRFVFSVIPVCILYSVIFLDTYFTSTPNNQKNSLTSRPANFLVWGFKKKYLFYILCSLLLLSNLMIFIPYLTVSDNKGVLPQIASISQNFAKNDLVLIDQKATGDGFSMMTGPMSFLYNKQVAYFINPSDVNRIGRSRFSHIYFIVPDDNLNLYEKSDLLEKLSPVENYAINTARLDIKTGKKNKLSSQPIDLPIEKNISLRGKIYLLK